MISTDTQSVTPARLSRNRQLVWVAIGAAVLLVAVLLSSWLHAQDPEPVAQPVKPGVFEPTAQQYSTLKIATVGQQAGAGDVIATGTIAVDEERSTPVVPPLSGQVTRVLVEQGQRVTAGQPLLAIRSGEVSEGRDAYLAATAQQQTARSQLKIAEENQRRQSEIYRTAGGALRDFQQAQSDLVTAQSAARTADAALTAARDKLAIQGSTPADLSRFARGGLTGEAMVRSPIAGVVASRTVSAGQYIGSGSGSPLFVITDPSSVWLVAQVAESDASHVRVGDQVRVTTPAWPGRTFTARVGMVGASLDPATHRLPVRATIANPDGLLKPQMFASFAITGTRQAGGDGLSVPASAVIREGDGARVWVAGPGHRLLARTVTVGDGAEDGMVRIVSGLRPGERIVTSGAIFVNEAGIPG